MEIHRHRTYNRLIPSKWHSMTRTNHHRIHSHIPTDPVLLIQTKRLQRTSFVHDSIAPSLARHHSERRSLILRCRRQQLHLQVRLDQHLTIALTLIWPVRAGPRRRVERTKTHLFLMDDLFSSYVFCLPCSSVFVTYFI